MAILQSCCCWRSVRKGSYASAVYTMGYFGITVLIMSNSIQEERLYWQGNHTTPLSPSFLEPQYVSHATMVFNVVVLCCSSCGVITSLLLIYGVLKDIRSLLVPWILTVVITMLLDISHIIYLFALNTVTFTPITAILFTLDFFLLTLNIYSLLCVISQYQEYKAGRGTAEDDYYLKRLPPVHYTARPTATSCLSTRRAVTYQETRASPTQSPTAVHSTLLGDDSASSHRVPSLHRKHVQFPDQKCDKHCRDNSSPDGMSTPKVVGQLWEHLHQYIAYHGHMESFAQNMPEAVLW
ncbi:uncharacterized protein LOC134542610 isoform X2 [Bacillus rossius redtenbacheri]|uniref:uncharacterized protein LOC134542610 isoform X2 n=1 Tax=Bacillus rossius redtenbacheri TaxID=93214 RepID=UPI002FDCC875